MELGTYLEYDGRPSIRFERAYPHPIDRVWAAVSESAQLEAWFPSKVDIEPWVGGTVTFSGDPNVEDSTGVVLAFDPPRQLAFTWGQAELHFDLEPVGPSTCRFVLIHVLEDRAAAARNAAGWSVCLAALDSALAGAREPAESWNVYYDRYVALGLPSGAPIPGR